MDAVFHIIIVCPHKGIPEIPRILSKNIIRHIKAGRTQILDKKHCRRSGVSLSEYMDLPQPRNEQRKVMDDFIHGKIAIGEFFLLGKIVIQSGSQFRSAAIDHRRPIKHPFLFRNIVIPNTSCMRIDTGKQLSVYGKELIWREAERILGKEHGDSG